MTFDSLLIYVQFERTGCVQELAKMLKRGLEFRIWSYIDRLWETKDCKSVYSMHDKVSFRKLWPPYFPRGRH